MFAHFLLKELKENQSPFLLPSDLHNRIKGGVAENANQTPILGALAETGGEVGGEFVLFRKGTGGTMEALLKRKAERLEQLEVMEAEARKADMEARALETEKQAELDALDQKIKALEAKVGSGDDSGGTLKELLALARQQQKQAKDLEALKRKKAANQLGLHDMSGNVYEWCLDWYGRDYYKESSATNPVGPETGLARVRRGGAFPFLEESASITRRVWSLPSESVDFLGFRICLGKSID